VQCNTRCSAVSSAPLQCGQVAECRRPIRCRYRPPATEQRSASNLLCSRFSNADGFSLTCLVNLHVATFQHSLCRDVIAYSLKITLLILLKKFNFYPRCIVCDRFLCLSTRLRQNVWTDLHEILREGVDWSWDDLIIFLVNSEKPRDAAMRNKGAGFVVLSTVPLKHRAIASDVRCGSVWEQRNVTWL